jgi:hypothetical protein
MPFRDLLQVGVDGNNGEAALNVALIRDFPMVRIAVQSLFKSPTVRQHGAREATS